MRQLYARLLESHVTKEESRKLSHAGLLKFLMVTNMCASGMKYKQVTLVTSREHMNERAALCKLHFQQPTYERIMFHDSSKFLIVLSSP